ncbi:Hypothetical predicted protein [Paramuricea clavata]|uniref:Uncharacterized protein n=1 Tax=Paramuricea clavata TaxID=317549 RepID=A0A6S7G571_PARCT|nr:Hypothetical predicted protein [Paramuricea clavata]
MPLPEEIDAENRDREIRVLNIAYPQTIENVHEKQCGIHIKINMGNITRSNQVVKYQTPMMYLPAGHYGLDEMLDYLNELVDEYDMVFVKQDGGRVGVKFNGDIQYVYQTIGTPYSELSAPFSGGAETSFDFEMTPSLEYMLGLKEWVVHPDMIAAKIGHSKADLPWLQFIQIAGNKQKLEHFTFYGKYMPDLSNGVSKLMIYCDEVEQSIVGDTKARLLASVPIDVEKQGSPYLAVYAPPDMSRKLIKGRINALHIGVYDTHYDPINFSAGVITLEAIIY